MVEVVHSGALEICKSISTSKGWVKRLFVLKRFHSSGTSALEYYKDTKKDFRKLEPKGVLNLIDNYQVEIVSSEQVTSYKKHVFDVRTVEATYRLAAESQDEMDMWVRQLQMQTKLKPASDLGIAYHVRPQLTEANKRIGASGECTMQMSKAGIKLALHPSGSLVAEWPLQCLRRYACDVGKFHFEAGRKAPLGEGLYVFQTPDGDSMFEVLDYLIKAEAGQLVNPPPELQHAGPTPGYHHLNHNTMTSHSTPAARPAPAMTSASAGASTISALPPPSRPPPALPTSPAVVGPGSGTLPASPRLVDLLSLTTTSASPPHTMTTTASLPRFVPCDSSSLLQHHNNGIAARGPAQMPPQPQSEYNVLDRGLGVRPLGTAAVTVVPAAKTVTSPVESDGAVYNKLNLQPVVSMPAVPAHLSHSHSQHHLLQHQHQQKMNGRRRSHEALPAPDTHDYRNLPEPPPDNRPSSAMDGTHPTAAAVSADGHALGATKPEWRRLSGPESVARDYDELTRDFQDDMIPNKFYGVPLPNAAGHSSQSNR